MKRMLNQLFITTQGAYLSKEREALLVQIDQKEKLKIPILALSGIVCFGRVSLSPPLMQFCAENQVAISFLSIHGRFLARVQGAVSGNVLLRREQFRQADQEDKCLELARSFIIGKIKSSRAVLRRTSRDHKQAAGHLEVETAQLKLKDSFNRALTSTNLNHLRGIEGEAARVYFGVFDHLILKNKSEFHFTKRNRRPPLDPVNAMLSFVYTLLMHDVRSALETAGLDPAVGFLHQDRPGRMSLALDIMEEFRAFFADRLVLSLINRSQVRASGFETQAAGAILMNEETRKVVITAYQERKKEISTHPFLAEKIPLGMFPIAQAMLLSRYFRGDLDPYPPYYWS